MMLTILKPSKILKTGTNRLIKSAVGMPYRSHARREWALSADEFWDVQNRAFDEVYEVALHRVPYYRDHTDEYPPLAAELPLLERLKSLPILPKSTVKSQNEQFWVTPLQRLTSFHTTSGTSGTPLRIPATVSERAKVDAIMAEWYRRITGTSRPKMLVLSGFLSPEPGADDIYWEDKLGNRVFLSIYALNSANTARIRAVLEAFRPQLIYGYASAVHQLALLFAGEPLSRRSKIVTVVTSEVLEPHWRATMEEALVRKVFNLYGSQEGAHAAQECEFGSLHINPQIGVIEVVNDRGEPADAGESGRVLATSLLRKSFPLIRYELADVAESTGYDTDCRCGLAWPTIGRVQGRSEDLVRTRDGRNIGYLCFHATKDLRGIKEAQLVQRDYESFVFSIVRSETELFDRATVEQAIQDTLCRRIQANVDVEFMYPHAIERGPNGKFKAVVVDFAVTR